MTNFTYIYFKKTSSCISSIGLLISAIGSVITSLPKFMMGTYKYDVNAHEEFCTLTGNITHPDILSGNGEGSSMYLAVLGDSFCRLVFFSFLFLFFFSHSFFYCSHDSLRIIRGTFGSSPLLGQRIIMYRVTRHSALGTFQ